MGVMNTKELIGIIHHEPIYETPISLLLQQNGYITRVGRKEVSESLESIKSIVTSTLDIRPEYFLSKRVVFLNDFNIDRILYADKCGAKGLVSTSDPPLNIFHALESETNFDSPWVVSLREKERHFEAKFFNMKLSERDIAVFRMYMDTANTTKIANQLNATKKQVRSSVARLKKTHDVKSGDSLQLLSRNIFRNIRLARKRARK